jgi:23S rRNA (cytosine1962-C5)-methyltransferase
MWPEGQNQVFDQRDSRQKFAAHARRLQFRTLNCYRYTGGFTVAALSRARCACHVHRLVVTGMIDAPVNVALNGFDASRTTTLDADVAMLRQYADKDGSTFDAIVLDPPSLPNRLPCRARRWAYKASTAWRYNPGARGVLFTYSCSGGVSATCFTRSWRPLKTAWTPISASAWRPPTPMTVEFPEGEYQGLRGQK